MSDPPPQQKISLRTANKPQLQTHSCSSALSQSMPLLLLYTLYDIRIYRLMFLFAFSFAYVYSLVGDSCGLQCCEVYTLYNVLFVRRRKEDLRYHEVCATYCTKKHIYNQNDCRVHTMPLAVIAQWPGNCRHQSNVVLRDE